MGRQWVAAGSHGQQLAALAWLRSISVVQVVNVAKERIIVIVVVYLSKQ